MEETSCDRKEVMQDLVGDVNNYFVTEGPFGRIRAKNNDTSCKYTHIIHSSVINMAAYLCCF